MMCAVSAVSTVSFHTRILICLSLATVFSFGEKMAINAIKNYKKGLFIFYTLFSLCQHEK